MPLSARDRECLLDLARAALRAGPSGTVPEPAHAGPALGRPAATFVTLRRDGALRGCIGSLNATRSLARDVIYNARRAAFFDPRFPPLTPVEVDALSVSISVLAPPELVPCASEAELLATLRPGVDGLILRYGERQSTFLPSVWDSLPTPREFVRELKAKAGLDRDFWAPGLRVQRYTAETIS